GDWLTKDVAFKVRGAHGPVWIMIVATLVSFAGIALAYVIYGKKSISRDWAGGEEAPSYCIVHPHNIFLSKVYKEVSP
ncbi:NADH-quinone oxidoreductase subunit L, partial [Bacillus sp. D-CC]